MPVSNPDIETFFDDYDKYAVIVIIELMQQDYPSDQIVTVMNALFSIKAYYDFLHTSDFSISGSNAAVYNRVRITANLRLGYLACGDAEANGSDHAAFQKEILFGSALESTSYPDHFLLSVFLFVLGFEELPS